MMPPAEVLKEDIIKSYKGLPMPRGDAGRNIYLFIQSMPIDD